jgi:hypothetical protein
MLARRRLADIRATWSEAINQDQRILAFPDAAQRG